MESITPNARLNQIEQHNIRARWAAFSIAVIVILALTALEVTLLYLMSGYCDRESQFFIILAIAPVVAVATITIFLLIGVFRGHRDGDMMNLPAATAARNLLQEG